MLKKGQKKVGKDEKNLMKSKCVTVFQSSFFLKKKDLKVESKLEHCEEKR